MTTFVIDDKLYRAKTEGKNLLEVCLELGLNVPYFCWHPVFRSIGACRQCAVKVFDGDQDLRGRIEMACMIPVREGMRVLINDPEAVAFRARVIEWLMINHPHDCPVCDEGGECHLQDMTVMTGHVYRRHRFAKRTHRDQDLGPFVNMEMNRCIQCYRCVRFYREYAGGRDFDALGWHDHVYFGRHADGILESEFSGNLVEVCPTGVFTDKSLKKHYTRKWDLQTAPSICAHCSLGCNTIPGERYGMLRRISPRYHGAVNGYFLCDRGRYGYEFVNAADRLRGPVIRENGTARPVDATQALAGAGRLLQGARVIGIGSPRASLESNFALRSLVGAQRFYQGAADQDLRLAQSMLAILRESPAPSATLREAGESDAVFILGEDVTQSAPLLDLALRQAALRKPRARAVQLGIYEWLDRCLRDALQDERGPFFVATPDRTKLDSEAGRIVRAAPDDIARLGLAVAHAIDPAAPAPGDLSAEHAALAQHVAAGLKSGRHPLIVSGPGCGSEAVLEAAANVARALCRAGSEARLCFALPECNSMGAVMLGGGSLDEALAECRRGAVDTLVVLENDLERRLSPPALRDLLKNVRHSIVLDHRPHALAAGADIAFPAATFAESAGTYVNNEGRAQRFFQVFVPPPPVAASWAWLGELMAVAGKCPSNPWPTLDALLAALAAELPDLAGIRAAAPPADFRIHGRNIPRQSARYSGRTAISAHERINVPPPPEDRDSALSFSMEGFPGQPPASLLARYWAPEWNSVQALNRFQSEVDGPLRGGDAGRRLIEPGPAAAPYFTHIPTPFAPRAGEWLLLPATHIFGSEELSARSESIARLVPEPYAAISRGDAERLGIAEGGTVAVAFGGASYRWPAQIRESLPPGLALLPVGLPGRSAWSLPAWGTIEPSGINLSHEDTP